jgi:hypothetical protein
MARVLNEEDQAKIEQVEHFEKKYNLLLKTIKEEHKASFFHKLFNKKCKLCKLMKVIE